MEWVILIIFSGAVVLASVGLISLLFAEIFKGRHQSEDSTRRAVKASAAGITEEERVSLTGASTSRNLASTASSLFRRKPAPSAAEDNVAGSHRPATHQ
jgi:hypothetical protein